MAEIKEEKKVYNPPMGNLKYHHEAVGLLYENENLTE